MYEPGVTVRRAADSDVNALADLVLRFYRFNEEFDPAWAMASDAESKVQDYVKEILGDDKNIVLVAEHEGSIVGFIRVEIRHNPLLQKGVIAVVRELYVRPQHRRKGVASALLREASRLASERGAQVMGAEFPSANRVASSFYGKLGFRPYLSVYLREVSGL